MHTPEGDFECKARGIFRNRNEKPLVGDDVEIEEVMDSEKERCGNIVRLMPRRNRMLRPEVANVDQAVMLFSLKDPDPSLPLLDRFLINMDEKGIPVVILFNKLDLMEGDADRMSFVSRVLSIYRQAGYTAIPIHTRSEKYVGDVMKILEGKTSVLSGPSGTGKSSLLNILCPGAGMATGELSRKISRGKNTTRHSELFCLDNDVYILDTPGFTSLAVSDVSADRLMYYYPEFEPYRTKCRYNTCLHIGESLSDCAVKQAVREGRIPEERYRSYRGLYLELRDLKQY